VQRLCLAAELLACEAFHRIKDDGMGRKQKRLSTAQKIDGKSLILPIKMHNQLIAFLP
jgi:hypothetical protein